MSKTPPKIFSLDPKRAISILEYLEYLDSDWRCYEREAKKDWITKDEWTASQMWIKSSLKYRLLEIKERLKEKIKLKIVQETNPKLF